MTIELAKENKWPGAAVLEIPMQGNDADAETIGNYLQTLLWDLYIQGEGFDSKRPFGNSCWEYEMYAALVQAGACEGIINEEGYVDNVDEDQAIDLIKSAILAMYKLPKKPKKKKKI